MTGSWLGCLVLVCIAWCRHRHGLGHRFPSAQGEFGVSTRWKRHHHSKSSETCLVVYVWPEPPIFLKGQFLSQPRAARLASPCVADANRCLLHSDTDFETFCSQFLL